MVFINKARGVTHHAEHTTVLLEFQLACLCMHAIFYLTASHASYLLSVYISTVIRLIYGKTTQLFFSCHLLLQISPHYSIILNAVFH